MDSHAAWEEIQLVLGRIFTFGTTYHPVPMDVGFLFCSGCEKLHAGQLTSFFF